jgi:hypothetical protein
MEIRSIAIREFPDFFSVIFFFRTFLIIFYFNNVVGKMFGNFCKATNVSTVHANQNHLRNIHIQNCKLFSYQKITNYVIRKFEIYRLYYIIICLILTIMFMLFIFFVNNVCQSQCIYEVEENFLLVFLHSICKILQQ